jgi:hypothetical protein
MKSGIIHGSRNTVLNFQLDPTIKQNSILGFKKNSIQPPPHFFCPIQKTETLAPPSPGWSNPHGIGIIILSYEHISTLIGSRYEFSSSPSITTIGTSITSLELQKQY